VSISWTWAALSELSGPEVAEILKIRQDVFILEQRCFYPDIDGLDAKALHLVGRGAVGGIAAYCRVFAPGDYYEEPAVGRVLVAETARGGGAARALMREAHRYCAERFSTPTVRLNAQDYLRGFYESLGYTHVRGPYDEDGIAHVEMLKTG